MKEVFNYLKTHNFLDSMEQIVVAGVFNGGIASLHWQNYLASITKTPIVMLEDAVIFPNAMNYEKNRTVMENRMKMVQDLVLNGENVPNLECSRAFAKEQWKCLFM